MLVVNPRSPVWVSVTETPVCCLNRNRVNLFPKAERQGMLPEKDRVPKIKRLGFS